MIDETPENYCYKDAIINNVQKTAKFRLLINTNGANPLTMQSPMAPFIGQIIITLTDSSQDLGYLYIYICVCVCGGVCVFNHALPKQITISPKTKNKKKKNKKMDG